MRVALFLAVLAACVFVPAAARAHGDPVSELLLVRDVSLPYDANIDGAVRDRLDTAVGEGVERGFKIKVALIAQAPDLGAAFRFYGKPQRYAEHLADELTSVHRGPLLVAMPNGFGYADGGAPRPRLARALAGLPPPGRDPTKLAEGATTAVRRLAAAAGHPLPPPKAGGGGSETRDRIVIAAVAAIGVVLVGAVVLVRRLRAQRHQPA